MALCLSARVAELSSLVLGRQGNRFASALAAQRETLHEAIAGRRILVVGGAGSIGSATVLALLRHGPATVTVGDPAENNGVELLRTVRSDARLADADLRLAPLDYGSPLMAAWLAAEATYDLVLVFAALKHVRSERDVASTLRLCEVNLLAADRFFTACRRTGHGQAGVFIVSTDKAADPVNLMGASKRLLEGLLWAHRSGSCGAGFLTDERSAAPLTRATTTRFANVAFSDGSLPWAFLQRLAKHQPLAAPADVRRFLVSLDEAAAICLLASLVAPDRHVLVPDLDPVADSVAFDAIAAVVLEQAGYRPAWYEDEAAARAAMAGDCAAGRYPVLCTRSDTSGEKNMETFVADDEAASPADFPGFRVIAGEELDAAALGDCLRRLDDCCSGRSALPDKATVAAWIAGVLPVFAHQDTGRSLDGKM